MIVVVTCKVLKTGTPSYLGNILVRRESCRTTRSAQRDLLVPSAVRLSLCDRGLASSAPVIWNNLPDELKLAPSVSAFKKHLKTHLFSTQLSDSKLKLYSKSLLRRHLY